MTIFQKAEKLKKSWEKEQKSVDRLSWREYFILQAYLSSLRSLDAQTQCGCVIVNEKNTILSTGYNSFIGGIDDRVLPNLRPSKYDFMIHAEHNAILNCARNGISCEGATVYVTGPPCNNCLQFMHQAGISKIFYFDGNLAKMTDNEDYQIKQYILLNLSKMGFYKISSPKLKEKIDQIKSLR